MKSRYWERIWNKRVQNREQIPVLVLHSCELVLRGSGAGGNANEMDVVNSYNTRFNLGLTEQEKSDLVEYLKSL